MQSAFDGPNHLSGMRVAAPRSDIWIIIAIKRRINLPGDIVNLVSEKQVYNAESYLRVIPWAFCPTVLMLRFLRMRSAYLFCMRLKIRPSVSECCSSYHIGSEINYGIVHTKQCHCWFQNDMQDMMPN